MENFDEHFLQDEIGVLQKEEFNYKQSYHNEQAKVKH